MTAAEASIKLVEELPVSLVESLIQQLRSGLNPNVPNPGYRARVDQFLRLAPHHAELAPMLEVVLAAKRSRQTAELVWSGPASSVVPVRQTEQVLFELIEMPNAPLRDADHLVSHQEEPPPTQANPQPFG